MSKLIAFIAIPMLLCSQAHAKCGCPDDGHGAPRPTGSAPITNTAPKTLELDGWRYVELTNAEGRVVVVASKAGDDQ